MQPLPHPDITFCMRALLDGTEPSLRIQKVLMAVVDSQMRISPSGGGNISSVSEVASIYPVSLSVGLQPFFLGVPLSLL